MWLIVGHDIQYLLCLAPEAEGKLCYSRTARFFSHLAFIIVWRNVAHVHVSQTGLGQAPGLMDVQLIWQVINFLSINVMAHFSSCWISFVVILLVLAFFCCWYFSGTKNLPTGLQMASLMFSLGNLSQLNNLNLNDSLGSLVSLPLLLQQTSSPDAGTSLAVILPSDLRVPITNLQRLAWRASSYTHLEPHLSSCGPGLTKSTDPRHFCVKPRCSLIILAFIDIHGHHNMLPASFSVLYVK